MSSGNRPARHQPPTRSPGASSVLMVRRWASPAVVLVGAAAYAALEGGGLVGFSATPLILGIIAVVAGVAGVRRRVVATGLVLAGWGVAVLLADQGVVPAARIAPAYMLGVGVGLVVAAAVAPHRDRGAWLLSASIAALTGPLSLYASYDIVALGRWPIWSLVLVAWSAWEAFWVRRSGSRTQPSREGA